MARRATIDFGRLKSCHRVSNEVHVILRPPHTSTLSPSFVPLAGVDSAPSSAPFEVAETVLFFGGIAGVVGGVRKGRF